MHIHYTYKQIHRDKHTNGKAILTQFTFLKNLGGHKKVPALAIPMQHMQEQKLARNNLVSEIQQYL